MSTWVEAGVAPPDTPSIPDGYLTKISLLPLPLSGWKTTQVSEVVTDTIGPLVNPVMNMKWGQ